MYTINIITEYKDVLDYAYQLAVDPLTMSGSYFKVRKELEAEMKKVTSSQNDSFLLGVYDHDLLSGVFIVYAELDNSYFELLGGFFKIPEVMSAFIGYMRETYSNGKLYIVYNPSNIVMSTVCDSLQLQDFNAQIEMYTEISTITVHSSSIIQYDDIYAEQYIQLHRNEGQYWTAIKVLSRRDIFTILLALDGDRVVGYLDMRSGKKDCQVFDVLVHPEFRRKGYGQGLVEAAINIKGNTSLFLEVDKDNPTAYNLYKKVGFKEYGERNSGFIIL